MSRRKTKNDDEMRAQGDLRPCRAIGNVVEWPHVTEIPAPPEWLLSVDGLELWHRMTPHLLAQRVFTTADAESFAHLCQMHGQIADAYRLGNKPTPTDMAQLRMFFIEFGMTPASRTKVLMSDGAGQSNKFARNGNKKT